MYTSSSKSISIKKLSSLNKNTEPVGPDSDEIEVLVHDFSATIAQLEVGQHITADSGKNLKEFEVTVITDYIDEDEEITAYCIDSLENGDTIFVNDVLVKVNGADV